MLSRIVKLFPEGTKPSHICAKTGIQPQTWSHLVNGRYRPSIDVVEKVHIAFPEVSLNWLIFGEGGMFIQYPTSDIAPIKKSDVDLASVASDVSNKLYLQSEINSSAINALQALVNQNAKIIQAVEELKPYIK